MKLERRNQIRRDMRACAAFVYDQSSFLVGKISTLSISGLSFEYSGNEVRTNDPMQIDILSSKFTLSHLTGLACRHIYDIRELVARQSYRGADIRRCGVEFAGLNLAQQADLLKLIGSGCDHRSEEHETVIIR